MRGTISRSELRQVIAATYHQAWWPRTEVVRFDGTRALNNAGYTSLRQLAGVPRAELAKLHGMQSPSDH